MKFMFVLSLMLMSFMPSTIIMSFATESSSPAPILLYGDEELDVAKKDLMNMIYDCMKFLDESHQMLSEKATADEAPELYQQVDEMAKYLEYARYQLDQVTSMEGLQDLQAMVTDIRKRLEDLRYQIEKFEAANVFTATTIEGVEMTFKVISEEEKTCQVGTCPVTGTNWWSTPAINSDTKGVVTIPSIVNGYKVTAIGNWGFVYCMGLTSVNIPEGLEKIGKFAFYACQNFSSVKIPASVSYIGDFAFEITKLESVSVDENNMIYDSRNSCNAIIETATNTLMTGCKNTIIPDDIEVIAPAAFYDCFGLTVVNLPETLTTIGNNAFSGCEDLTAIHIPKSVNSLDSRILNDTPSLSSITVDNENPFFDSRDNCNALIATSSNTLMAGCQNTIIPTSVKAIAEGAFHQCSTLTEINIPNGVENIGEGAFFYCRNLSSVQIAASVKSIGVGAFKDCHLSIVTSYIQVPFDINEDVFSGLDAEKATLYVPYGTKALYEATDGWNKFQNIVEMEAEELRDGDTFTAKTVEGIDMTFMVLSAEDKTCQVGAEILNEPAISKYTSGQITIPSTANGYKVISVGKIAFFCCTELTSVIIPNGVESISSQAFGDCYKLTEVSIPNSVISIGSGAFGNCGKLTSITIPNSVTSIGQMAFSGSGLTSITIPHSVTKIEGYTFQACRGLTTVAIPSTIAEIDGSAFRLCTGLTSIEVEEGNTRFASQDGVLFTKDMTTLVCYPAGRADPSYTIPNSVTQIGTQSFAYCLNLTSMDFPSSLQSIGWSAFTGCSSLASVTFPNSLTWINMYAFQDCSSLTSITIPGSVNHLSEMAFNGCTGLKEISFEKCLGIDALLIGNCTGVERVVIYDDNPVAVSDKAFWLDWDGPMTTATLYVPFGTKALYEATNGWNQFANIVEMEPADIDPLEKGEEVDFGEDSELTEDTDLGGVIADNMYFNIPNDKGRYEPVEGCIVITSSTSDEDMAAIEGKEFFDKDLMDHFAGFIFKVPAGQGNIRITAETTGDMTLRVKIGDDDPIEKQLDGRRKVSIPYNVSVETLVYVYAGQNASVKGVGPVTASSGELKIYSIEREDLPTDIANMDSGTSDVTIYSLSGQRLTKPQKGVNIVGGKKVLMR